MKLKLLTILSVICLVTTLIITSCSKEGSAGAPGATGPAGPSGPAGSAGAPGATGATGAIGTANVIYSDWIDTVKYQSLNPANPDSSAWIAQIDAPRLVDSIINQGDIKVYLNLGSDSLNDQLVVSLPINDPYLIGDAINPYYQSLAITLIASFDESSFTLRGFHHFQYRYILIPGGIKTPRGTNGSANSGINWDDYKQVKAYLKLKD